MKAKFHENDENVARCRRAREALVRRFKTLESLFAYLNNLDAERRAKGGAFYTPAAVRYTSPKRRRAAKERGLCSPPACKGKFVYR